MSGIRRPPVAPLFVPGSRPERFANAARSGADAVILDLEDAVAPEEKAAARRAVTEVATLPTRTFVRINAPGTPWYEDDLAALARTDFDGVVLPKASRRADLEAVRKALGERCELIALVETVAGIANIGELLETSDLLCLAFGSVDYALDLGCAHTRDALHCARSEIVFRSRLADVAPLDGVTVKIDDMTETAADARHAADLGFRGKLAIHPRQIAAVLDAFHPDEETIERARRIVAAVGEDGAVVLAGEMIDAPTVKWARRLLEQFGEPPDPAGDQIQGRRPTGRTVRPGADPD